MNQNIENGHYFGERQLYASKGLSISHTIFDEGESPLKESADIALKACSFKWKYPLWYCRQVIAENCIWFEMARAGVWYSCDIDVRHAMIEAPKNFRRCNRLKLSDVQFSDAAETLWNCNDVEISDVTAKGNYFAMNCQNMKVSHLKLFGDYSFDGVQNAEISDSHLLSKDAFWNTDHVTVRNSYISGEYLGWNARNLTLVDCTIESLQGLCYIDNLIMKNCKLLNTTLAFEYSSVDAEIDSHIDSVINPKSGTLKANSIGKLIIEKDRIDPSKTRIICRSTNND